MIVLGLLLALWLLVIDATHGQDVRLYGGIFVQAMADELRGAPGDAALAASRRFDAAGLRFDYPAALRLREDSAADGHRTWTLEYGQFTLDVHAADYDLTAVDYLDTLGDVVSGWRIPIEAVPATARTPALCGAPREMAQLRMKIVGEVSHLDAFDLPAPPGQSRIVVIEDTWRQGRLSPLAQATRDRLFATLRCADAPVAGADANGAVPPAP